MINKDGKCKEYLYYKVEDKEEIKKIKGRSERWEPIKIGKADKYYVMVQCDADKNPTGSIRIVSKEKIRVSRRTKKQIKVNDEDWIYYRRRKNN